MATVLESTNLEQSFKYRAIRLSFTVIPSLSVFYYQPPVLPYLTNQGANKSQGQ